MNIPQKLALYLGSIYLGSVYAQEQTVVVEVPCYARDNQGVCTSWGGLIQGCTGRCVITGNIFLQVPFCAAEPGSNCNSSAPTATSMGTTPVKIPCLLNDADGKCIRWGAMNQGCLAPAGGTCETNVTWGDRRATCKAEPGAQCNSSIRVLLP